MAAVAVAVWAVVALGLVAVVAEDCWAPSSRIAVAEVAAVAERRTGPDMLTGRMRTPGLP